MADVYLPQLAEIKQIEDETPFMEVLVFGPGETPTWKHT